MKGTFVPQCPNWLRPMFLKKFRCWSAIEKALARCLSIGIPAVTVRDENKHCALLWRSPVVGWKNYIFIINEFLIFTFNNYDKLLYTASQSYLDNYWKISALANFNRRKIFVGKNNAVLSENYFEGQEIIQNQELLSQNLENFTKSLLLYDQVISWLSKFW